MSDALDNLTLLQKHAFHSMTEGMEDDRWNREWTVYTDNQGRMVAVQHGLELTFLEGEEVQMIGEQLYAEDAPDEIPYDRWACHTDPTFVRPATKVSRQRISWNQAVAFIRENHGQMPLPMPDQIDSSPEAVELMRREESKSYWRKD